MAGLTLVEVGKLLSTTPRPVTLTFDIDDRAGDDIMEASAQQAGLSTARVNIEKLGSVCRGQVTAPAGIRSRDTDIVELEYTAMLPDGSIFDSTAARGRPFGFILGNGDVVRGLEIGTMEM